MRKWSFKKTVWLCCSIGCLLIIGSLVFLAIHPRQQKRLPTVVTNQVSGFTVYYYAHDIPGGFKLQPETVQYSDGKLFFILKDARGYSLTFGEQAMPEIYANSELQGTDDIETAHGKAAITSVKGGAVYGAMLDKTTKTLITLNTTSPVDTDTIKDLFRSLQPL